ncbi:MAG: single-stranded nucleic acid binding protein [Oscillospiraceae bacterium]|jgi:spoIIIJ-associated protein|nr:single-stranded nucleic acid binding protein [Oscillospiraceae bacterium]
MIREVIASGRNVEDAIENGCVRLGKQREDVEYEIVELPKKGLFGKIKAEAQVKVFYGEADEELTKLSIAQAYIKDILGAMGIIDVEQIVDEREDSATITLKGEDLGVIIGRRGETLDALQYLVSLACNKADGDYYRITVDCGNFREKREKTLQELAQKISKSVLKTGRSCTLEPMNPYERRIIHAVISEVEGVSSKSVGEEPHRKVVISSNSARRPYNNNRSGGYRNNNNSNARPQPRREFNKPSSFEKPETKEGPPAEKISDKDLFKDDGSKLYSKIDL